MRRCADSNSGPGERLLDVGCGTGVLLEALSASVPDAQLSGADPSPEMLEVARKRLGKAVFLKESHAESLPFPATPWAHLKKWGACCAQADVW